MILLKRTSKSVANNVRLVYRAVQTWISFFSTLENINKLQLKLFGDPDVDIREGVLGDSDEVTEDKRLFPFEAQKIAVLHVIFGERKYVLHNPAPFKYDGATIPFGLCKGDTRLLTPSLFHDLMCRDKSIIGYDRFLSSLVYYKLLRMFKVNLIWASVQFMLVDGFQSTRKGWK